MFECFSEPNGGYSIMAIDESKEAYIHVVRVLLDAAIDSPIDLLLRADNCTSIDRLRHLINQPGLHERPELLRLNDDQYKDLLAIESYINWTYNNGHSDITTRTRETFERFSDNTFDATNPIMYDEHRSASQEHLRLFGDIGEWHNEVIGEWHDNDPLFSDDDDLHPADIRRVLS